MVVHFYTFAKVIYFNHNNLTHLSLFPPTPLLHSVSSGSMAAGIRENGVKDIRFAFSGIYLHGSPTIPAIDKLLLAVHCRNGFQKHPYHVLNQETQQYGMDMKD